MPFQKSILLVEDNSNDVELALNAFKRNNVAHEVAIARHGGEALDYLFRRGVFAHRTGDDPLFVMLDLKMPKVDGFEVLEQIKADENLKLMPVVMLTSSKEEADVVKCYRLGANAYVVKPVNFTEFVEAIKQIAVFWTRTNQPPPHYPIS